MECIFTYNYDIEKELNAEYRFCNISNNINLAYFYNYIKNARIFNEAIFAGLRKQNISPSVNTPVSPYHKEILKNILKHTSVSSYYKDIDTLCNEFINIHNKDLTTGYFNDTFASIHNKNLVSNTLNDTGVKANSDFGYSEGIAAETNNCNVSYLKVASVWKHNLKADYIEQLSADNFNSDVSYKHVLKSLSSNNQNINVCDYINLIKECQQIKNYLLTSLTSHNSDINNNSKEAALENKNKATKFLKNIDIDKIKNQTVVGNEINICKGNNNISLGQNFNVIDSYKKATLNSTEAVERDLMGAFISNIQSANRGSIGAFKEEAIVVNNNNIDIAISSTDKHLKKLNVKSFINEISKMQLSSRDIDKFLIIEYQKDSRKLAEEEQQFEVDKITLEVGTTALESVFKESYSGSKSKNIVLTNVESAMEYITKKSGTFLSKELADVYIECENKWAYSEEFQVPIGNGIDELILPYSDYDYSQFKGKVIDKEGKPIDPLKILDKKSFLTKFPIEHPIEIGKDIGLEYIDVDVRILKHLIEVLFNLWRKKAFKLGASDMKEAVNILIEDLITYVNITYEGEDLKQAYRVVRLIRWYAESSINRYATYQIDVEYGKLSSDLHLSECKIPHSFSNMYIDNSKYLITNQIIGNECYAEFYIDNPIDTEVKFIVQALNCTAEIFINDVKVEEVSNGIYHLGYDLTKDTAINTLKIYSQATSNGIINISNVVISEMIFKDYKLTYHAERGQGNKIADKLINQITIYEQALSGNQELIEKIKNNNYPISDFINNLYDYCIMHHNDKDKGKRLTIKQ